MDHRPRLRPARWLAAVCLTVVVAGCGGSPLESVGERSNDWIGPIADGVTLLSKESAATSQAAADENTSVSATEGAG